MWEAHLGEMYVAPLGLAGITALLDREWREFQGKNHILIISGDRRMEHQWDNPVHNYYLLLLNNTICCAPIRFSLIYNIDMLLALPNQYLLLQTIEMTSVLLSLPPLPIFQEGSRGMFRVRHNSPLLHWKANVYRCSLLYGNIWIFFPIDLHYKISHVFSLEK